MWTCRSPISNWSILPSEPPSVAYAEALAFDLNGVPVRLTTSPHEHGTVYAGVLPDGYRSSRRFTRLMMHTLAPVRWNAANPERAYPPPDFEPCNTWVQ